MCQAAIRTVFKKSLKVECLDSGHLRIRGLELFGVVEGSCDCVVEWLGAYGADFVE